MSKVVVFIQDQGVPRELVEELLAAKELQAVWRVTPEDEKAFDAAAAEAAVALVTVNKAVTAEVLATYPNIKVLAVAFTGYGIHDLAACEAGNISVFNVPDYSAASVAEMVIGLTLAVYREIPAGDRAVRDKLGWAISAGGTELAGKTVGIFGTGSIGLRTARLFAAFDCKLIGHSRTERPEFAALGGKYVSREELFSTADVLSVHIPFNKDTAKSIGAGDFARIKPSAVFINTARGTVVDEDALAACLAKNKFRAGIDVFTQEPLPADSPLVEAINVEGGSHGSILIPHVGYKTTEALGRKIRITLDNILAGLSGVDKSYPSRVA